MSGKELAMVIALTSIILGVIAGFTTLWYWALAGMSEHVGLAWIITVICLIFGGALIIAAMDPVKEEKDD